MLGGKVRDEFRATTFGWTTLDRIRVSKWGDGVRVQAFELVGNREEEKGCWRCAKNVCGFDSFRWSIDTFGSGSSTQKKGDFAQLKSWIKNRKSGQFERPANGRCLMIVWIEYDEEIECNISIQWKYSGKAMTQRETGIYDWLIRRYAKEMCVCALWR